MPATLQAELRRLTEAELSLPARFGYVALLLASSAMTAVTGSLWLTEPSLPLRTSIAFAVMTGIGIAWIAFAAWVLTHKRILLARHRVVAGRLSVTFCSLFLLGALAVGITTSQRSAFAAAGLGALMLGVAIVLLWSAHRAFARLEERREQLGHQLGLAGR